MYKYAWVVLDLFAVLVLLGTVYHSARKGFVRTVLGFCGYVASAALAGLLSPKLAQLAYDHVVRDAVRLMLTRQLEDLLAQNAGKAAVALDAAPGILRQLMRGAGRDLLTGFVDGDAAGMARTIVDSALEDPVLSILRGVCFFLIFALALLIARRLGRLFTGIYRIPIIGTADTVLGGIVGVLEAAILLYLIGVVLHLVVFSTGGALPWLNEQVLEATYIYRVFL